MIDKEIVKRLNLIHDELKISKKEAAKRLHISPSNYSQLLQGKRPAGNNTLEKYMLYLNVNREWILRGGKGKYWYKTKVIDRFDQLDQIDQAILLKKEPSLDLRKPITFTEIDVLNDFLFSLNYKEENKIKRNLFDVIKKTNKKGIPFYDISLSSWNDFLIIKPPEFYVDYPTTEGCIAFIPVNTYDLDPILSGHDKVAIKGQSIENIDYDKPHLILLNNRYYFGITNRSLNKDEILFKTKITKPQKTIEIKKSEIEQVFSIELKISNSF